MRRTAQPRKVEALARECRRLLEWLRGPGQAAEEHAFAAALAGYVALRDAVAMLPRGAASLKRERALLAPPRAPKAPDTQRAASSFSVDEVVLLDGPVLTPQGWIVPAPLVARVDAVAAALRAAGKVATDKAALTAIIEGAAEGRGESKVRALARDLGRLQVRLSRERAAVAAVSAAERKVPPKGASA